MCLFYRRPRQPRASKLQAAQEDDGKPAAGHAHTGAAAHWHLLHTAEEEEEPRLGSKRRLRPMHGTTARHAAQAMDPDEDLFGGCSSAH